MIKTGVMLSTIRGLRHISQKQLAQMSGVPHPYICRFEQGTKELSMAHVQKLEAALGVSFEMVRPSFERFAAVVGTGNGHPAPAPEAASEAAR